MKVIFKAMPVDCLPEFQSFLCVWGGVLPPLVLMSEKLRSIKSMHPEKQGGQLPYLESEMHCQHLPLHIFPLAFKLKQHIHIMPPSLWKMKMPC